MILPPSLYHLFCSRGKCWEEVRLETLEKLLKTCREKRMGNAGVWDGDLGTSLAVGNIKQEYRDDFGSCCLEAQIAQVGTGHVLIFTT